MTRLTFSDEHRQALRLERFEHPHPRRNFMIALGDVGVRLYVQALAFGLSRQTAGGIGPLDQD